MHISRFRKNYEYKDAIECNKLVNENIEYFLNHFAKPDSIASSLVKLSDEKVFCSCKRKFREQK